MLAQHVAGRGHVDYLFLLVVVSLVWDRFLFQNHLLQGMDPGHESRAKGSYLVNSSSHKPANPSGMQNLQTLFGLDDLAASVARVDAQGNKIAANKLNKTYKKQIVDLGISGGTEIPKNKFLMDLLMAGAAHEELDGGYRQFTNAEMRESFNLRPGVLNGYVKYRPPSPSVKRVKQDTPTRVITPRPTPMPQNGPSRTSRRPTPSPPQTRSTAPQSAPEEVFEGDESSDDGSRFKELERERKKKLKMKREAEMAMGGDYKRRRYDVDGYEFLDSD